MPSQIEFIKPDSGLIPLFKRAPVTGVTKAEQVQDLLGQDILRLTVETAEPVELNIGGKIVAFGKQYTLNQLPTAEKKGERKYSYEMTLEGPQYDLRKPVYFNTDVSGFNTSSDFPLTGDIEMFVDVLINNANRVFGAGRWIKGVVPTTDVKTITISESNCLGALQQFCKEFEQEFDIVQSGSNRILNIRKAGEVLGHIYEYGRGYGLHKLRRQTVTDADIITRLYPYGANKNLKPDYRNFSQRLKLADPGYIEDAAAIASYGVIERTVVYEDIYPKRIGTVSGVGGPLVFSDASMNFDLNEADGSGTKYLIQGNNAKIHFNTGNLAGYEFEIVDKTGYNHATKTFTLIQFEDERGLKLPSAEHAAFQINVGDQYVILDIMLPDTYVEVAENELRAKAQLWLDQNKFPKVQYVLEVDRMYLEALHSSGSIVNVFSIGDYIQIKDDELGIDKSSRVISMTRDLLNPYQYSLTIDDTYQVSIIQTVIESQKEVKTIIKTGNFKDPNTLRRGWMDTQELLRKIYDTDGYFDGGKIKPLSVETAALVVGAKSQQYVLRDILFQPNYESQANVISVSSGYLDHYAIMEGGIKTWSIEEAITTIPDNNFRYIFAKVSKTNQDEGYIIFDTYQWLPDEDTNFYHFLVGNLHSVIDGVRGISLTYGFSAINGRFITTGRVQSADEKTYFDLDLGAIGGYIKFIDSQGNYRDLSDIGAATDRFYEVSVIEPLDSYINGKITAWFRATDPAVWPAGEEDLHAGDMWFNSNALAVFRRTSGGWINVSDPDTIASYIKQYTRLGNNKHVQMFTALPAGPYAEGDLWMSPDGLRRSIANKVTGFDPNNWVEPFNFDNTSTAIDGGIITSGTIQLAGDKNAVWAGVSGEGTDPESVRFWAGASTVNRDTAPFRVNQAGEVYGRTRIEVEGVDSGEVDGYKGQAGLAGSETEDKSGIRIYAGSDWEGKEVAPFRVDGEGNAWMDIGRIGTNMKIQTGSITNQGDDDLFNNDATIVFRHDPTDRFVGIGTNMLPGSMGGTTALGKFSNNQVSSEILHLKYAAIFEASGGTDSSAMNYAFAAPQGVSLQSEALLNGRRTLEISLTSGAVSPVDPRGYDTIICNYGNGAAPGIRFEQNASMNSVYYPIRAGKEIAIISNNDVRLMYIMNIIQGDPSANIPGGGVLTLIYTGTVWRVKALHDNNW
jgi:hypothetical protein